MAILNYTTKVSVSRTVGEVTALLAKKGAQSVTAGFSAKGQPIVESSQAKLVKHQYSLDISRDSDSEC